MGAKVKNKTRRYVCILKYIVNRNHNLSELGCWKNMCDIRHLVHEIRTNAYIAKHHSWIQLTMWNRYPAFDWNSLEALYHRSGVDEKQALNPNRIKCIMKSILVFYVAQASVDHSSVVGKNESAFGGQNIHRNIIRHWLRKANATQVTISWITPSLVKKVLPWMLKHHSRVRFEGI